MITLKTKALSELYTSSDNKYITYKFAIVPE